MSELATRSMPSVNPGRESRGARRLSSRLRRNVVAAVLLVLTLLVLIPFAIVVLGSFKTPLEASEFGLGLPSEWRFDNYAQVFEGGDFARAFMNSTLISVMTVPVTILISGPCAYYLSRVRTRWTRGMFALLTVGVYLPVSIIPSLFLMQSLKLSGTLLGISLIYIAIRSSWCVFLLTGYIASVPRELDEAARIDGCGPLRTYFLIIFPLTKPVLVTCTIIIFMWNWNDFQLPIYFLSSNETMTLPLTVYAFFGSSGGSWNLIFANLILCSLPIILIFFLAQRHVVSGMTAGAVKG